MKIICSLEIESIVIHPVVIKEEGQFYDIGLPRFRLLFNYLRYFMTRFFSLKTVSTRQFNFLGTIYLHSFRNLRRLLVKY